MTGRLEEQTNALRTANSQLDTRRAFIEAVLSSVTAGVVAVDMNLKILLLNRSAENFLQKGQAEIEGRRWPRSRLSSTNSCAASSPRRMC